MDKETTELRIRAVEIKSNGGDFYCETCHELIASGTCGIIARQHDSWYMVTQSHTCDSCSCESFAPILCYRDECSTVVSDLINQMQSELSKFALVPLIYNQILQ